MFVCSNVGKIEYQVDYAFKIGKHSNVLDILTFKYWPSVHQINLSFLQICWGWNFVKIVHMFVIACYFYFIN